MGRKKTDHGRGSALAEGPGPSGFQIKGRLWLEKNGETFLSWGRVVLLERIRELGSIAAAARSMDMAYSHAWTVVAEMDRLAGQELVSRTFGGRHGGRAWLTPAGEVAVSRWQSLNERLLRAALDMLSPERRSSLDGALPALRELAGAIDALADLPAQD